MQSHQITGILIMFGCALFYLLSVLVEMKSREANSKKTVALYMFQYLLAMAALYGMFHTMGFWK